MKVILTEAQMNLLKEDSFSSILCESLMTESSFAKIWDKIKQALVAGVSVAVILTAVNKLSISSEEKAKLKEMIKSETATPETIKAVADSINIAQQDTKYQKQVQAVKDCMSWYASLHKMTIDDIQVTPEKLVSLCKEKGFNLPFAVAQMIVESGFGTAPRSRKTNSVFNVGSYDNGKNVCTYNTQDDSIEPYMDIIMRDYLGGTKTFNDLLLPGGYVNQKGMRYASAPNYEANLAKMIRMITSRFPDLNG